MTTTVLDLAAGSGASFVKAGGLPSICRIGLLGLGNVGSAFARMTREVRPELACRGLTPSVSIALVRTAPRLRPASKLVRQITANADDFFAEPMDVIVEALGGVEPAHTFVARALDRGIPVVTANKSLMAAHGDALAEIARRRRTALRFEATCIAGVPFLGTFERRPLGSRASGLTAILNGTSNAILTAISTGQAFAAALADAQRLGLAEPDPAMDISGADAAEKLAILLRLFAHLIVDPASIPTTGIGGVERTDTIAAARFAGAMRPVSYATWQGDRVRAFVGPAFLPRTHSLARVAGLTNGIELRCASGTQCYVGPGAGPEVTAATLLDDVAEVMTERCIRPPSPAAAIEAGTVTRPESEWFVRIHSGSRHSDVAELLASYGVSCRSLSRIEDCAYALTRSEGHARIEEALAAMHAATGLAATAFPALTVDAPC